MVSVFADTAAAQAQEDSSPAEAAQEPAEPEKGADPTSSSFTVIFFIMAGLTLCLQQVLHKSRASGRKSPLGKK